MFCPQYKFHDSIDATIEYKIDSSKPDSSKPEALDKVSEIEMVVMNKSEQAKGGKRIKKTMKCRRRKRQKKSRRQKRRRYSTRLV